MAPNLTVADYQIVAAELQKILDPTPKINVKSTDLEYLEKILIDGKALLEPEDQLSPKFQKILAKYAKFVKEDTEEFQAASEEHPSEEEGVYVDSNGDEKEHPSAIPNVVLKPGPVYDPVTKAPKASKASKASKEAPEASEDVKIDTVNNAKKKLPKTMVLKKDAAVAKQIEKKTGEKPESTKEMKEVEKKITKKSIIESMLVTGATIEQMAEKIVEVGIDSNLSKNKIIVKLWLSKMGFNTKKEALIKNPIFKK